MPRQPRLRAALALAIMAAALSTGAPASASPTATSPAGNALALTPPMGFNNWARYGCAKDVPHAGDSGPSESLILAQARAMVTSGLAASGYDTVTIDDCWTTRSRDASGRLVPDPVTFPNGIEHVGDRLHAMTFTDDRGRTRSMKLGIYTDIGTSTCGGYPGSWGHVQGDVDQFAAWGVDYVKVDGCHMPPAGSGAAGYVKAYADFAAAMRANAARRDMVFSASAPAYFFIGETDLSDWYTVIDGTSGSGQLWRNGYDVIMRNMAGSRWDKPTNGAGIMAQYAYNWPLSRYAGPGSWNDPDFLITGEGLTDDESRTQMALWAMMASPLILSVDVAALSPASLATLKNRDVIAVDQDPLGRQAGMVSQNGTIDVLARPLAGGDRAVALLNRAAAPVTAATTLAAAGFPAGCTARVKDLWTGATTTGTGPISARVPAHGTAIFRVTPGAGCAGARPTGQITGLGGRCLDDRALGTAEGNPVILYRCNAGANQRWTLPGDGTVRTLGQCLDARHQTGDPRHPGYRAALAPCDGRPTTRWTYQRNGFLRNDALGRCLDVHRSRTADLTPVVVDTCANAHPSQANQVWALPV
ncbi:ricin-type beta-trefoil lectin domain protein [Nonomuraea sp. NBC_01738]|uniref:ricin-type beta-trefoil lectin domain protein n=1 Tax=Nonomuraea sp. NBC_01738 TaxID=2976003 RepID=UPI002E15A686|nr:ricin-type beta-trefoil lectin domain protein [Nonomuraea sp. NBC_01738]